MHFNKIIDDKNRRAIIEAQTTLNTHTVRALFAILFHFTLFYFIMYPIFRFLMEFAPVDNEFNFFLLLA